MTNQPSYTPQVTWKQFINHVKIVVFPGKSRTMHMRMVLPPTDPSCETNMAMYGHVGWCVVQWPHLHCRLEHRNSLMWQTGNKQVQPDMTEMWQCRTPYITQIIINTVTQEFIRLWNSSPQCISEARYLVITINPVFLAAPLIKAVPRLLT